MAKPKTAPKPKRESKRPSLTLYLATEEDMDLRFWIERQWTDAREAKVIPLDTSLSAFTLQLLRAQRSALGRKK